MPTPKKCVHPLAAIIPVSPIAPHSLMCKLCRKPVTLPTALQPRDPPKSLVEACAAFIKYVSDHSESGAQVNPRHELALILAMNDALHAHQQQRAEG